VFADGSAARLENACTATCGDRHLSAPPLEHDPEKCRLFG